MSFTYDVATDRGKVRLSIADTNAAAYTFEDEEIDAVLSIYPGQPLMAGAILLRSLAANRARMEMYYRIHNFEMDRKGSARVLMDLADGMEKRAQSQPFEIESVLDEFLDQAGQDHGNYVDTEPNSA